MTSDNSTPTINETSTLQDARASAHSAPTIISITDVEFGERGRTNYDHIEQLAESIRDVGLIEPIVLKPLPDNRWLLIAGGRRMTALRTLGVTTLWYGVSSEPGRPGYVIKHEQDTFTDLCAEIAENEQRLDVDWRDKVRLFSKAFRLARGIAAQRGETIIMRDFGKALNVNYCDLQNAVALESMLLAQPELFAQCSHIREAYTVMLKESEKHALAELARRVQLAPSNQVVAVPLQREVAQVLPGNPAAVPTRSVINNPVVRLTDNFHNMSGLDFMRNAANESFDHIVTDPDYGVAVERLEASVADAGSGVAQNAVADTLDELAVFFAEAFRITRNHSFVVLWCDLDHWEKLSALAVGAGFRVQRWPIIWHKLDYRSNAAPGYNFTKNIEYAMVCRKPGATLATQQPSSVIALPSEAATKQFNHPFAKPVALWQFLYAAIAIRGQSVLDPFAGSGSAPVAAIRFGLRAEGCEINPSHYMNMLLNLQTCYKSVLGENLTFAS